MWEPLRATSWPAEPKLEGHHSVVLDRTLEKTLDLPGLQISESTEAP